MGAGLAVILLGIIILMLVPFIYFGIRMAGYPKLAIAISITIFLIISIPLLKLSYRSQMYSKEDAMVDFNEANLPIKGTLRILENDISGFKSIHQQSTFLLDSAEVNQLIHRMEIRKDFIISPTVLNLYNELKNDKVNKVIRSYRHKDRYFIETYQKLDEYTIRTSTFTLKKNNDTVLFKKLEE